VAIFVATDYKVTLGTTNVSTYLTQTELGLEADEVETTAFGATFRTRVGGLKNGSITLQFNQDFGAGGVDALLFPLLGSAVAFVITPSSTAVSATNPSYSGTALVVQYTPIGASVGDLATFSVTWPTTGAVTRATA
jgi:hypothetical protein